MVSIIIPILNEEKGIRRNQENLKTLEGEFEVIFSDGGSTDRTLERIDPDFRVVHSPRGRGIQMNTGAKEAQGDVLFFVHSDVLLKKDVLLQIPDKIKRGEAAGCLKIVFDSSHILMRICGFMSNLRVKLRRIVFADQGILIQKKLFEKMGGMPQMPLMEDYEFSLRMKKKKIPIIRIDSSILVSSRRFQKYGMLWTMWQMQKFQLRYRLGGDVEKIAKEYENIR